MKRMLTLLLTLVFCVGLLTACAGKEEEIPAENVTLWVVTELTDRYGMNDQANKMIRQFQEKYPNVTVKLDILPTDEEERAVYLNKIRTQIMGGGGPDVYLMPTRNVVPVGNPMDPITKNVEPLFRDVKAVMHNGIFYDISEFYDADDDLDKDALNTSVMDGGTLDGGRFVLPLRYQFGIYAVDPENLEVKGYDAGIFESVRSVMSAAVENKDADLLAISYPGWQEYYFSDYVDYNTCEVLLTKAEVAEYLKLYQQAIVLGGNEGFIGSATASGYSYYGSSFAKEGFAVGRTNLSDAMGTVLIAKMLNEEVELYPQRDTEGDLNAIVFYYAAVGAGSENPRLAYEFATMFLSEEAQFETYLTNGLYQNNSSFVCDGWPVRTVGSVEARLKVYLYQLQLYYEKYPWDFGVYSKEILDCGITLTDSDVPAVSWQVDEVRFPIIMEESDWLNTGALYTYDNGRYTATDADIDAIAREYIENLQLYLDEG